MFAIPQAIHAPVPEHLSTLMRPLQEVTGLWQRKPQAKEIVVAPKKLAEIKASFHEAMGDLEEINSNLLYCDEADLQEHVEMLRLIIDYATPARNQGKALVETLKKKHSISRPAVEAAHKMFMTFYRSLQNTQKNAKYFLDTPNPDENSPEFAEFLVDIAEGL